MVAATSVLYSSLMELSKNLLKILIIEDNSDDEALLMRQLHRAGLGQHIKTLNDGKVALEFLMCRRNKAEELAAIFIDLKVPRLSGITLLEYIKEEERLAGIPIIVMTSSNSYEEIEACRGFGVDDYVSKPLTFSSFAKAFADTFHSHRARRPEAVARAVLTE